MQEMKELYRKNKEGDTEARDKLVSYNLPLVRAMAGRYAFKAGDYDDLYQEGCLGLLKALEKYDPEKGAKFSTYAVPFILGEIRSYLRKSSHPAKVSRSNYDLYIRLLKNQEQLEQELKRKPRLDELAVKMECEKEEIVWLMELQSPPLSLQEKGVGDLTAIACGEEGFPEEQIADHLYLEKKINNLPSRERQIIVLRYFLEKSQEEVAKILNLSQSYLSRLERKILQEFKKDES